MHAIVISSMTIAESNNYFVKLMTTAFSMIFVISILSEKIDKQIFVFILPCIQTMLTLNLTL